MRTSPPSLVALLLATLAATLPACAAIPQVGSSAESVVYGTDDRVEVYEAPSGPIRTVAEQAVAIQMDDTSIDETDPAHVVVTYARTLGEAQNLCAGQRFADQIEPGYCSGTLIDDRHILTAGHCMAAASDCSPSTIWVLGLRYASAGVLAPLTSDDVYRCSRVLAYTDDGSHDYSVVELDRPVVGHAPAVVSGAPPALGSDLTLIGHPNGIPMKVAAGGVVTSLAPDGSFGEGTVDAFAGNSGSGIFNDVGQLVAVLDSGNDDYVSSGGCFIVNVVHPPPTSYDEGFTSGSTAIAGFCAAPGVVSPICDCVGACTPPTSGDICSDAEVITPTSQVIHASLVGHRDSSSGSCGGDGFDHFYRFTLTEPAFISAQVECNDDIVPETNLGSRLNSMSLPAGDYVLVVDGYAPGPDAYTLTLEFGGGASDAGAPDAGSVDAGGADGGSMGLDGGLDSDAGVGSGSSGGGCSCSIGPSEHSPRTLWLLFGFGLSLWALRRRRSRARDQALGA